MGNRIYGCDDCLAVCPWNKFAEAAREAKLAARQDLTAPRLADLLRLDDAASARCSAGSPVKRTGRDRFIRNVLIAAGNSGDSDTRTKGRSTARRSLSAGQGHGGVGAVAAACRIRIRAPARPSHQRRSG